MVRSVDSYDESDARFRTKKGSRRRTKDRPSYRDAVAGTVIGKDRGRCTVVLEDGTRVVATRARELRRASLVVGDEVKVVGDTSGRKDTLARIVTIEERRTVLLRTADDTVDLQRYVVANADLLLIVTALADPPPRAGFVERAIIAAFVGGVQPVLCLTKSDLGDAESFAAEFRDLDIPVVLGGMSADLTELEAMIRDKVTCLIGHSGVGKSTLVNRLVPDAQRQTGDVSGIGRGRHTSTQTVALELPEGGWIVDTPGVRSLGLAHVNPDVVAGIFDDIREAVEDCPRGCTHLGPPSDPECALDVAVEREEISARRVEALRTLMAALRSNNAWEIDTEFW